MFSLMFNIFRPIRHSFKIVLLHFLKDLVKYLQGRVTEIQVVTMTELCPTNARSLEPRALFGSPKWVQSSKHLDHPHLLSLGAVTGMWIRSGTTRLESVPKWDTSTADSGWIHYITLSAPSVFLLHIIMILLNKSALLS